jgi:exodeoxyribonuclease VII large subunit
MDFSKKYKLGSEKPLSVSQCVNFLNEVLKKIKIRVIGEVVGLQIASSGHVYFSLKDKKDNSVLRCVVWKSVYSLCGVRIEEGMEIIVSGTADIYPARGTLAFKAETIELVGEGALKKAYDELKLKLEEQGFFKQERKKPLPEFPLRIGVITSLRSGTVIHDLTSNLGKFGFQIQAFDSRVEGQEAVKDLLKALKVFKETKIDVLVIIRGGGSLESLMAFNNETLVKEIADFPVPVISGIGHHKDETLVALTSDFSESTPTAVANLLNKPWEKAHYSLEQTRKIIIKDYQEILNGNKNELRDLTLEINEIFQGIFEKYKKAENDLKKNLIKLKYSITRRLIELKEKKDSLFKVFQLILENKKDLIEKIIKLMEINNPERNLKLGYAIVKFKGAVLKKASLVKQGDSLNIQVSQGEIVSEVKKVK